jgi:hypothetical protein
VSPRLTSALFVAAIATGACEPKEANMDPEDNIPIACVLSALTHEQREREGVLVREHMAFVQEVREHADGFAFRYPADIALFVRIAELVALEHRCCPFLTLQLEWSRGPQAAPWLNITGGARIKEFVRSTFAPTPR